MLEQLKFTLLPHMAGTGSIQMEMFTGESGKIRGVSHIITIICSSWNICNSRVDVHTRTVDLEEDHRRVKSVHPCAAGAGPGLALVAPAVTRLHVSDGVVLAEAHDAPFPVEDVAAVSHRVAGFNGAGENHRSSPDDVPGWTDGQGYPVRRI